jgi:hypothetical protein
MNDSVPGPAMAARGAVRGYYAGRTRRSRRLLVTANGS